MTAPTEAPEKMPLTSMDIANEKRDELKRCLKAAYPEVFAEEGIDFDQLKRVLGEWVEPERERFGLNWPGKAACMKVIQAPSVGTLKPCPEESVDWDTTQNLFIEGDNLEVLKLLQKAYFGKVKMIYIDPPYNTGKEFIYPDKYAETLDTYLEYTGQKDSEGRKFSTNTDTSGRFHSRWLNMMYPRLYLAKNLLRDDGVIFISIDNHELTDLKNLCDIVFGEENFVEVFCWVKTSTPPALATKSRKTTEYIICYEKSLNKIKYSGEPLDGGDQPLLNTGNTYSRLVFPKDKTFFKLPDGVYPPKKPDRVELINEITINGGYANHNIILEGEFKWSQDFLNREVDEGTTFIVKSDKFSVRFIRGGDGYKRPTNFIKEKYTSPVINKPGSGVGTNETATSELSTLMGGDYFDYPKPVSLIKYLSGFLTEENDLVLDFFAGSATTAEAVLQKNLEDSGNRRFIMVQLPEPLDPSRTSDANERAKIEAAMRFLTGLEKPNNIAELGKERIRRAANKIKEAYSDLNNDLGFRTYKLNNSCFKQWKGDIAGLTEDQLVLKLQDHAQHIDTQATAEDILYELLLKDGFELTVPIQKLTLAGKDVFSIEGNQLLICLEPELTQDLMDAMADRDPARVIVLDAGFQNNDQLKANAVQTFKARARDKESAIVFRTV